MRSVLASCVVACLGTVACASHVDLRAPAASAPLDTRLAAYDELKGLSYHETTVTTYGTIGSSTSHSTDYMQLANGTRVYYPEDLLPVVPDDSPSAKAATASESKRETAHMLTWGTVASAVAGAALIVLPFTTASEGHVDGTPILIGLGIAVFGGIGFGIASHFVAESAQDEAATAYETYDRGLQQKLNLCARGDGLAECAR
jgi:hypothetical protein